MSINVAKNLPRKVRMSMYEVLVQTFFPAGRLRRLRNADGPSPFVERTATAALVGKSEGTILEVVSGWEVVSGRVIPRFFIVQLGIGSAC